nr:hypothetical protein Iba_chr04cCG15880 [Ipomoea batatas]
MSVKRPMEGANQKQRLLYPRSLNSFSSKAEPQQLVRIQQWRSDVGVLTASRAQPPVSLRRRRRGLSLRHKGNPGYRHPTQLARHTLSATAPPPSSAGTSRTSGTGASLAAGARVSNSNQSDLKGGKDSSSLVAGEAAGLRRVPPASSRPQRRRGPTSTTSNGRRVDPDIDALEDTLR